MSPGSASQLADSIRAMNDRGERIPALDLRGMNRIRELAPADMTVTAETGISLRQLQEQLSAHRQWLPVDPPNGDVSVHDLLARNLSGPRRFGYGTIREHLIGMKVVLADGRTIKSGGRVVKNVAGYDLAKLFIGARDSLGIIVEATFKLRPLPEMEVIVGVTVESGQMASVLRSVLESELTPVVLDAHRVAAGSALVTVVLGLAGTRAEVEWQLSIARTLGLGTPASLDYDMDFCAVLPPPHRVFVLPSRVPETIVALGSRPFVARAGNGAIYFRGEPLPPRQASLPGQLTRRMKLAYDPKRVLPEFVE